MQRSLFSIDDQALARVHALHLRLHEMGLPFVRGEAVTIDELRELIEAAFWASLKTDEGRSTRAKIIVMKGSGAVPSFALERVLPYGEKGIAKLAPAVPAQGFLWVSAKDGSLTIDGIEPTGSIDPTVGLAIDIYAPGVVRVSVGMYQPYVVFSGRDTVFTEAARNIALPAHLQDVLRKGSPVSDIKETQAGWRECLALSLLARLVVEGGHGGTMLVVPDEAGDWLASIEPYPFRLARPETSVPDGIRQAFDATHAQGDAIRRLHASSLSDAEKAGVMAGVAPIPWNSFDLARIASLAAVDGAVILGRDARVFGFGAKIKILSTLPLTVCAFEPQAGEQEILPVDIEMLGGTRHQSAVRFVAAHHDTVAMIASQDRRLSVVSWNDDFKSVFVLRNVQWWT